jgi:hypothetical protein
MLRQNIEITVEDKQRLMPFVATPRGEILFDGPAWIATLMGNKTNGGGTTSTFAIIARVTELAPNGRRLEDHIDNVVMLLVSIWACMANFACVDSWTNHRTILMIGSSTSRPSQPRLSSTTATAGG